MPIEVTVATLSFVLFVLVQLSVFHVREVKARFGFIMRVLAMAAFVDVAVIALLPAQFDSILSTPLGRFSAVLVSLLILAGLFVSYMPFYYVVAASVSIRTLILIDANSTSSDIARFAGEAPLRLMLVHRLESLVRSGNLVQDGCGFRLTGKGAALASVAQRLKALWRLGPGG